MKKYITLLLTAVLLLSACAASTPTVIAAMPAVAVARGSNVASPETGVAGLYAAVDRTTLDKALDATAMGELSAAEIEGLLYMREEEKLARDVYLTLYETWSIPVFQNIASSEVTHMEAVKTLIDRYDLQDPAAGQDVGVFANETLQGLYDQLVTQGSQSLTNALRVGAAIEEIDILDLEEYLTQTDKADIQRVYQNLIKGSRNHLRAFVNNLERRSGETYEPQYLDQVVYDEIIGTDIERGRGRGS
jgi:hypothetical protein